MTSLYIHQRYVDIAGHAAALMEAGEGPTIVLLPSMLIRSRAYRRTLLALARRGFRVIAVEMPGCGEGSKLPRPWSFDEYAAWLIEFIAAQELHQPIIIGHSCSAPPPMIAAAKHPEMIGSVILCGPVGFDQADSVIRLAISRGLDLPLEPGLSAAAAFDVAYNIARHPRNFLRQVWNCAHADLSETAQQVRVPVLLAWGKRDHTVPLRRARLLCNRMSHCAIHVARHGSHDWLIEQAGDFARAVQAFLDRDKKE